MIYTEMTVKAMKMAYRAHLGQVDGNGVPYIFHPYHLAEQMSGELSCTVALLHDVVEDTSLTLAEIEGGFPKEVVDAIKLLTHHEHTDYFDYVSRIKENPVAKEVKLADLAHNMDEARNVDGSIPQEKLDRWRAKYTKAREILLR